MTTIDVLFVWMRKGCCMCGPLRVDSTMCGAIGASPSPAALWVFAFGVWMVLLGLAFVVLPAIASASSMQSIGKMAAAAGFPAVAGVWSRLFGVSIAAFGLFYFAAAAFELRQFFWMSVFGRLGVFGTCTLLAWRHGHRGNHEGPQPHTLLWFATPDLVFATITACIMLPQYLARVVFVGGVGLLTSALGFLTFPAWIMQLVGVKARPDTWNVVLGALLGFFGLYDLVSAMLGLGPILVAAVLANIGMLIGLLVALVFERDATRSNWRFKTLIAVLLVATALALFESA